MSRPSRTVSLTHITVPNLPNHSQARVPVYITRPQTPSQHAIVILTDVFGFTLPNTRLIADQFAANGYLTVIPDLFNGNEVTWPTTPDFNLQTYIDTKMPRIDTVDPIIEKIITWLKRDMDVKKLGGVGYCFGGKYVCRWLKDGGLDAGFTAHPSFVDADEVRGIQGPLSIAAAGT
jgi:dienelactone hydrolase